MTSIGGARGAASRPTFTDDDDDDLFPSLRLRASLKEMMGDDDGLDFADDNELEDDLIITTNSSRPTSTYLTGQ